jgi:hypothetical protein
MPQSEYQIPSGEHSLYIERDTSIEVVKNNEVAKENRYTPNRVASALDDVYNLYGDLVVDRVVSIEDVKISADLYTIAEDLAAARLNHLDSAIADYAYLRTRATESIIRVLFNRELSSKYDRILTDQELKNEEGKIGADIFGPINPNETRIFFNDNRESWFFYQEKTDSEGKKHSITLHYEVRSDGIWKIDTKDGLKCELVIGQDLENFINATKIYHQRVMNKIYKNQIKQNDKIAA